MKFSVKLLLSLILVTLVVISSYRLWGDQKRLVVSSDKFGFFATNDQFQGGTSLSSLIKINQGVQLDCTLKKSDYAWPYCGVSVHFYSDPKIGLDLSGYHTLELDIDYDIPPNDDRSLRVYFRNYNPIYSNTQDEYTHKYNGVTLQADAGKIIIPMRNFQVMTWWVVDNKIPIQHAAPEFTNINKFELATGSNSALGAHSIKIHSITLVGRYIAGETLFLFMLGVWIVVAIIALLWELRNYQLGMEREKRRASYLSQVNLRLESENIKFSELAHKDELTGIRNRHAVRAWLERQQLQIQASSIGVLFIDIDHFKRINDTYGHGVGDDVLREFAMVLSELVGSKDKVVRWGGEEFVVFCQQKSQSELLKMAEQIRHYVHAHLWVHGDEMSCSIGVALGQNHQVYETINFADDMLYEAKQQGRNCVRAVEISA
ncbi:GGDEF family protein [Vibrio maritimus]|uniref:diguanylate cyclase n=1 Tax=Vibrio maritimus TaxID=990268 RepID=A0A090T606_9VIBR|nr:GGDEF family protein [Vibrio maritimus]